MAKGTAYVVSGAKMKCDKGSHTRSISLSESHGVYSNGSPIMIKSDNVVGTNISDFGVCKSKDCRSNKEITIASENGGKITGRKCAIKILQQWINAKEDTIIDEAAALTTDSVLICARGGRIRFVSDGQA